MNVGVQTVSNSRWTRPSGSVVPGPYGVGPPIDRVSPWITATRSPSSAAHQAAQFADWSGRPWSSTGPLGAARSAGPEAARATTPAATAPAAASAAIATRTRRGAHTRTGAGSTAPAIPRAMA